MFLLDASPTSSELSNAINYLLANFGSNLSVDLSTGIVAGPQGYTIAYFYKYMSVKYADSADGSVGFSNSPTNKQYYGIRNSDTSVESTNPVDYIWYKASGGFGTTKFLFYQTSGGRQIQFFVGTAKPNDFYIQDAGTAIDLDVVTTITAFNNAIVSIYQWTATSTPPARPTTTSTYTWATGSFTPPAGWTSTPTVNTTAGSYLWAITIVLVASANLPTSVLDWTNTSFPIYVVSSNGATGSNGLSTIEAYLVQSQTAAAPGGFPQTTSGTTLPAGWSATLGTVTVGNVAWYTFGRHNGSSVTIDGIAPNTTYWASPVAASIFQDIRSDNWNGSTPPSISTPSTWGTAGYYISRDTGNVYFNNGVFRGSLISAPSGSRVTVNEASGNYMSVYDSGGGQVFGVNGVGGSFANVYVSGASNVLGALWVQNASGYNAPAVVGTANTAGATGVYGAAGSGGVGVYSQGKFGTNDSTLVTNLNANYLNGYTESQLARIFACDSGTANASGSGVNFNCTITGYRFRGTSNIVYLEPTSDRRLKENISPETLGLDFIKALKPVTYNMIGKDQKVHGFIAQDVESLITGDNDSLKFQNEDGIKGIDYLSLIAPMAKAIQELTAKVEALEKALNA